MKKRTILYFAVTLMFTLSCKHEVADIRKPNVSAEVTVSGLSDIHWTYFSFEQGKTVGNSDFCDEKQDAEWAQRTDWDFAICGDHIKTNSGDSGIGKGGVLRNTTDAFATLEIAPTEGYETDETIRVK